MVGDAQEAQPLVFHQPAGATRGLPDLILGTEYIERFNQLKPAADDINERFLAAAVLLDESGEEYEDSELTSLARNLAAAHDELSTDCDWSKPVISLGDEELKAGYSTGSGLYLTDGGDGGPRIHIPEATGIIRAIFDEDAELPEMEIQGTPAYGTLDFEVPDRLLTSRNLNDAPEFSRKFLMIGTLMVGETAAAAFFAAATDKAARAEADINEYTEAQERKVALQAIKTLREHGFVIPELA